MTLVEFLTARLAEEEQVAWRACEYASAEWHLDEEFGETVLWWPPEPRVAENERRHGIPVTADVWRGQTVQAGGERIAPHIARHDPARVLRDVEAKRRRIELHSAEPGQHPDFCGHDRHELPCPTLRLEALPYDDHPDYRTEWRPA